MAFKCRSLSCSHSTLACPSPSAQVHTHSTQHAPRGSETRASATRDQGASVRQSPVPPPDGSVEGQTQQKRTRWHQHKRTRWHQQKEDTLASTEEDTLASTAEQLARHLPLGVVGTRCPPLPSPALLEHISARAQHKATETDAPRSQGWGAAVGSGARRHAPRAIPISMRAAAHTGSP